MSDARQRNGFLDAIEWVGNKLPDPTLLFLGGAIFVMVVSQVAVWADWSVTPKRPQQVVDTATGEAALALVESGDAITPVSLLTSDGLYWCISSMKDNFIGFAPLGVVLVGMLGIGVAERTGLIGATLKAFMLVVPRQLLTPTMVFLGIMSSMGLDAGYIVLPPLAAALYKSIGRSPLAGIAAVFAGVSAGFNANLFVTGLDPMLAELSTTGAQIIEPAYQVAATCNLWFMIASTFVITCAGWATSSWIVERRLSRKGADDGGPAPVSSDELHDQRLKSEEVGGLKVALGVFGLMLGIVLACVWIPGGPLHGSSGRFARWVDAIVPLIFLCFVVPGLAYGMSLGSVKNGKDVARLMIESMSGMAPIIVLAFFAGQFIEYFKHSNLDRMLAMTGGQALFDASLPPILLMVVFVLVVMLFNMFIGSMSAKYTMFAPIFIPMFMMVGISPELTQAAYRIGDSVTNTITPLNAYLIIILVFMQQYSPKAGMGTLVAMMMPYTVVFTIVWLILLMAWMVLGLPLGIEGPLDYVPAALP